MIRSLLEHSTEAVATAAAAAAGEWTTASSRLHNKPKHMRGRELASFPGSEPTGGLRMVSPKRRRVSDALSAVSTTSLQSTTVEVQSPITALDMFHNDLVVVQADAVAVFTYDSSSSSSSTETETGTAPQWTPLGEPFGERDLQPGQGPGEAANPSLASLFCHGESDVSLAGHHALAVSCPDHGFVHLYEFGSDGQEVWTLVQSLDSNSNTNANTGPGKDLSYAPDGSRLAVSTEDGRGVHIIDLLQGTDTPSPLYGARTTRVSRDATYLLQDDGDSVAHVYHLEPAKSKWKQLGAPIFDMSFTTRLDFLDLQVMSGLSHLAPVPFVVLGTTLAVEDSTRTEFRVYQYDTKHNDWRPMGPDLSLLQTQANAHTHSSHSVEAVKLLTASYRMAVLSRINERRCLLRIFAFGDDNVWQEEIDSTYSYKGDCALLAVDGNKVAIVEHAGPAVSRVRIFVVGADTGAEADPMSQRRTER